MADELHVVAFNVPWPADYGGVMDVYYRLRALNEAGIGVHLHCFTYGRAVAPELEKICASVSYYKRNMSWLLQLGRRPFIVSSRDNNDLIHRLQQDHRPVLLEGVHCCSLLEKGSLGADRPVAVRAHNVETDYYSLLSASENRLIRKTYLKLESCKLRGYESILTRASAVFAVSGADNDHFSAMGCRHVYTVPCGNPNREVTSKLGRSDYAIYHGNLSVPENEDAVMDLISVVFRNLDCRLVVAGHAPSEKLRMVVGRYDNITLVADPTDEEMDDLVANAQVNILTTRQATGLKVKLLNSLFKGRHCLVNDKMVEGSGLADLCMVTSSIEEIRDALVRLMGEEFTVEQVEMRRNRLHPFVTSNAIQPILDWLKGA